jgi:hypothetical protein
MMRASNATREGRYGSQGGAQMRIRFSQQLMDDLVQSVRTACTAHGIVNILQLAEDIRRRNEIENVALEDIAEEVMLQAQRLSAAMEFDRPVEGTC